MESNYYTEISCANLEAGEMVIVIDDEENDDESSDAKRGFGHGEHSGGGF